MEFPEHLLNALRDGRLVVFAGAGVSMGPPAGLPDFRKLAEQVAEGTGESISSAESEDQFLGRLKDLGTDVHRRAAEILQRNNPEPTTLHLNLLRLFTENRTVRAVTTNFDDLFEHAALAQFDSQPRISLGPTLPLGNRFHGIVHLHGSVNEPEEMVLTHRDFGRAYLTESDGWARRFLIALFTNYTVLFVGYSHNDTIMTYLTPSLPPDGDHQRFALIGEKKDDPDHWRRMGIEPVTFPQPDSSDFSGLDAAVFGLANFLQRGVLDWQREITAIAGGHPPIDDESAGIIEHALHDAVTTRFFVEAAKLPEWINWLDRRNLLGALFTNGELDQRHQMLVWWLVSNFGITHDGTLFALLGHHRNRLGPVFWKQLCWQMQKSIQESPDEATITRWVLFLATTIPTDADEAALSWLAEACAFVRATDSLLRVYDKMMKRLTQVPPRSQRPNSHMLQYYTQQILSECIRPNLPEIAEPLLAMVTMRLNERHASWAAWQQGDARWSPDNYRRSAIEPHEQDNIGEDIDALINAARECLEWLAANVPAVAELWCNRHSNSEAPLLRRLAIHAMSTRSDLSAEDKIAWLLERCDVNETAAHHEIFRVAARAYPQTSPAYSKRLIEVISQYQAPPSERYESKTISAYHQFNWFHWLHKSNPNCEIAKDALDAVQKLHPEFEPREHPEFLHWHGTRKLIHPWPKESFPRKSAAEALYTYFTYHPTDEQRFYGSDRSAIANAIGTAAQADVPWGLDLADTMVRIKDWDSQLWQHLITAWTTATLDYNSVKRVLSHLSASQLHQQHPREIAKLLGQLVRKTEDTGATELPRAADSIALALHPYVSSDAPPKLTGFVDGVPQYINWLDEANNHASGQLALFWTHSIVLWRRRQEPAPRSLSTEYLEALNAIIEEEGVLGKFGRTVLASNLHFYLAVDEDWTVNNLLPLFDTEHEDFQCAWDGFLSRGRLSPEIADLLREKFVAAIPRVFREFQGQMTTQFVQFYVAAMGWLINETNDKWITEFFSYANAETRKQFAVEIGHWLRDLDESSQQECWSAWLKDYWENRLKGVPRPLDDEEIAQMLEWVMHLSGVFPQAVSIVTRMRPLPAGRSLTIHNIGESDLTERHPGALAKLLIHYGECEAQPMSWRRTRTIVDQLLAKNLPEDIDRGLRELIAKYGPWMGG